MVAVGDLVSDDPTDVTDQTTTDTANSSATSNRRRNKRARQESALVPGSLEHKWRRLTMAGAAQEVIDLVLHPDHQQARLQYSAVQKRYNAWCASSKVDPLEPDATNLINFLAYGQKMHKWSTATVENYRSAILDLFEDRTPITNSWLYKTYFQSLNDMTICPAPSGSVNIAPVLDHFRHIGSNTQLEPTMLTHKLAWLLGVCGFMRPSDIERIDLDQTKIPATDDDTLILLVVAPKERRKRKRTTKTITIARHLVTDFCPVQAFLTYRQCIATEPYRAPHPNLSEVCINYLLRDLRDYSALIKSQCISKHIRKIMDLIPAETGARPVKAWALGSTRVVLAGADVDDVVVHGAWSSQAMFDDFYRLSRETRTNFTTLTLSNPQGSPSRALNTQSLDLPSNEE